MTLLQGKLSQATDINTFLQIQNQLFPVEQQLQQLQNQQTVLENSAAFATITTNLSAPGAPLVSRPRLKAHADSATVAWRYLRHNSLAVLDGLAVGGGWDPAGSGAPGSGLARRHPDRPTAAPGDHSGVNRRSHACHLTRLTVVTSKRRRGEQCAIGPRHRYHGASAGGTGAGAGAGTENIDEGGRARVRGSGESLDEPGCGPPHGGPNARQRSNWPGVEVTAEAAPLVASAPLWHRAVVAPAALVALVAVLLVVGGDAAPGMSAQSPRPERAEGAEHTQIRHRRAALAGSCSTSPPKPSALIPGTGGPWCSPASGPGRRLAGRGRVIRCGERDPDRGRQDEDRGGRSDEHLRTASTDRYGRISSVGTAATPWTSPSPS